MSIRPYTTGDVAHIIALLGKDVPEDQWQRELVQNAIDAGAKQIFITAVLDPEDSTQTRQLLAVIDDGHGMDHKALEQRMGDIGTPLADGNYGIGARISTLRYNPAGVYWASKVAGDPDICQILAMPSGLQEWKIDDDGSVSTVVISDLVDHNVLPSSWASGTVVALNGDGVRDTWTGTQQAYRIAKNLSRRYFEFGLGNAATVHVSSWRGQGGGSIVPSTSRLLLRHGQSNGTVALGDGARADWFVLTGHSTGGVGDRSLLSGAVCLRDKNELYYTSVNYLPTFGIYARSAQSRVVIMITPAKDTFTPNAGRTRLVTKSSAGDPPWKEWGASFVRQFPPEIEALLPKITLSYDAQTLASKFDKAWLDKIKPTARIVSAKHKRSQQTSNLGIVVDSVVVTSGGTTTGTKKQGTKQIKVLKPKRPKQRKIAIADPNGKDKGIDNSQPELPMAVLVPAAQWRTEIEAYDFEYQEQASRPDSSHGPALFVKEGGYTLDTQLRNWTQLRPDVDPKQMVDIVFRAYTTELIAKIVNLAGVFTNKPGWAINTMDKVLSPEALTFAALGIFSADALIDQELKLTKTSAAA